jgi:hypothetical protein
LLERKNRSDSIAWVTALLLTVPLLLSVWPSDAISQIRLGVTGGLARYSFAGDKPDKAAYTTQNRATFGGIIEIDVYDGVRLSIQPSLIQKGTGIAYEVKGEKERVDSVSVDNDYFSLPVMMKIFTPKERWFVSSGLELAWLLNAKHITSSAETDVMDVFDEFDLAIHFGIGWTRPVGRHELFIEGRYTQSIRNVVSEDDPESELYGLRLKNSGILFMVGFLFQL